MITPLRMRTWLLVIVVTVGWGVTTKANERVVQRDGSLRTLEAPSPPPPSVRDAIVDAGNQTGVDPALLLAIAWAESRFRADAKSGLSSAAGLMQFTQQTWLENMKAFGEQHGFERISSLIARSDDGNLHVHSSVRRAVWALRYDPSAAALFAAARLNFQREVLVEAGRPPQPVDLYLVHALGAVGATRLIEAVEKRPLARCRDVVGEAAWKQSGLFTGLPRGASTSVSAAYVVISERIEQNRSYYANLLRADGAPSALEVASSAE